MELIAFASGKGGTGKTLMASCLGYALIKVGHRVLLIDADPATDGLSLFLLGRRGLEEARQLKDSNTFTGIIQEFQTIGTIAYEPQRINREGKDRDGDHEISYKAIISGKGLYGDDAPSVRLDRSAFRDSVTNLFSAIRASGDYDYVLVDTRGGFSFESTDVCALADSFIVVTDPDITSFYQDRNLVKRISEAAQGLGKQPVLRSIIVNRATAGVQQDDRGDSDNRIDLDRIEVSFRNELTREFPVTFGNTHPVPADIEVLKAYKTQRAPYLAAPASLFSFSTLSAFREILKLVTTPWSDEHVQKWNQLVQTVSDAVDERNKQILTERASQAAAMQELESLRKKDAEQKERISTLEREIERTEQRYERELARSESLWQRAEEWDKGKQSTIISKDQRSSGIARIANLSLVAKSVTSVLVLLLVAYGGFFGYRLWQQNERQQMLKDVYNPATPASLRQSYLSQLLVHGQHNFSGLVFENADLSNQSLSEVSFRGAKLVGASFAHSRLSNADFTSADLTGSDFREASLDDTILKGAVVVGADFTDATVERIDVRGANFSKAIIIPIQLKNATMDKDTILPFDDRQFSK